MPDKPEIVCLCGSSRFVQEMAIVGWEFEKDGKIVLGLHLLPSWYEGVNTDHQAEAEGVAEQMDELHLRKIDLADTVFIYNRGGYIGDSCRREIAYAEAHGKPVMYLESVALAEALEIIRPVAERAGVTEEEAKALLGKLADEDLVCPACNRPLSHAESPRLCMQCMNMLDYSPYSALDDLDGAIRWLQEEWAHRKRSK
jgi:hypothetical protein